MNRTPLKKKPSTLVRKPMKKGSSILSRSRAKVSPQGKNKPSRPKTKSISKLKKELEALQKQVVKKLYGNDCYTCPALDLQGKNCHLGHVPWPRTDLSPTANFEHQYTRIQCFRCNIHLGGAGARAYARMQSEGIDMQFLRENADEGKGKPVPRYWYEEKIAYYKGILESVDNAENPENIPHT